MIKQIKDIGLIKFLLKDYYDKISYDNSPSLEDYVPKGVWFVLITEDRHAAGVINLEQLNNITWIPHVIVYDNFRGNDSYKWGIEVVEYMKQNYGMKKLIAFTPYQQAKRFAEKMGFTQIGVLSQSIQKDGKVLDQYILELSWSEVTEKQI